MRVCGVELKGGEAIISLLSYEGETYNVPDCRQKSFAISNSESTETMRDFHFAFGKLIEDYRVDEIVIIQREQKGKGAGSVTSFKLEALIQILPVAVSIVSPVAIKEQLKRNPPQVDFEGLELKRFQKNAFEAAYAFHNMTIYKTDEA
ncbi:DUF3010 family protein [Shewanella schlegeliana]|uniref:DUF3010 family protein n=1 Tax=Shewanella schlegeliana TaxID=190308 RepID=A0ABS1SYV3_9GAMM|nr:DUF3010 family protein [Shewanella schlegeliana]MBL4913190.1 DUF3010 family protein [Shewanella schlegeliana]MCL1109146.1 DUF3010 family protein [Shewanella schlegeliana]GIU24080.1 hypothetical protein TUM4433_07320 [Shewanella schlegeliana]